MELILEANRGNQIIFIIITIFISLIIALIMIFQFVKWIIKIRYIRKIGIKEKSKIDRISLFSNKDLIKNKEYKQNNWYFIKKYIINILEFIFRPLIGLLGVFIIIVMIFYQGRTIRNLFNDKFLIYANEEIVILKDISFLSQTYKIEDILNITNIHEITEKEDSSSTSDYILFEFANGDSIKLFKKFFADDYKMVIEKIQDFFPQFYIERITVYK